jgi:hypothetical protein
MGTEWEAIDRAEERLVARSAERRSQLARRERRRRWLPWLLAPLIFPAAGAAVLLFVVERAGGDFGAWTTAQATTVIGAGFAVPAALSAWSARRLGVFEAVAWAVACVCVEAALVFGIGFLALGLGPE